MCVDTPQQLKAPKRPRNTTRTNGKVNATSNGVNVDLTGIGIFLSLLYAMFYLVRLKVCITFSAVRWCHGTLFPCMCVSFGVILCLSAAKFKRCMCMCVAVFF